MLFNYVYKNGKNYFWVDVYPIKISMCIIEKSSSNHKSFKNRLECVCRERETLLHFCKSKIHKGGEKVLQCLPLI